MVAYKGIVKTAIDLGGLPNALLNGLIDARTKVMLDSYVVLASELSGSTLSLGATLPKGANIIAIALTASAAQASLTASVGDAGSATRYASAHTGLQTANAVVWIPGKNYVVTGTSDTQLVLTTGGATATAGTVYAAIFYAID